MVISRWIWAYAIVGGWTVGGLVSRIVVWRVTGELR